MPAFVFSTHTKVNVRQKWKCVVAVGNLVHAEMNLTSNCTSGGTRTSIYVAGVGGWMDVYLHELIRQPVASSCRLGH